MTAALLILAGILIWPARGSTVALARAREAEGEGEPLTVDALANATVLLALALRSGRGVTEALDEVARLSGPAVGRDLGRVTAALRWGRSTEEAWSYASSAWRPVAVAMALAQECGSSAGDVLLDAAGALREDEGRQQEAAAGRASVLLVLPLGLCFLPAFIATGIVPLVSVLLTRQLG